MLPIRKSLALRVPAVREYVLNHRAVVAERDRLATQLAILQQAAVPQPAGSPSRPPVEDWTPAKSRKAELTAEHWARAAQARLTPCDLDAPTADALATAACVLEPTAALAAVARIEGASVFLTRQLDERAIEAVSPTFPERRTRPERAPSAHRFGAWKAAFASWYRVASDARGSSRPVASHSLRP